MNTNNRKNQITPNVFMEGMHNDEILSQFLSIPIEHHNHAVQAAIKPPTNEHNSKVDDAYTWKPIDIPLVSNDFFRSKNVIEVSDRASSTIAKDIFTSNRNRSVHAIYEGATAHCKTSSSMKFTIRLMRASDNKDTILVDVRKKSGCSIEFRNEYHAIVRAAVYGEIIPRDIPRIKDIVCLQNNCIPLNEGIIQRNIDTVVAYLVSEVYDTRVLALQCLLLMTDPASKETSSKACKLIMETHAEILEYVLQDIMKQVEDGDMHENDSEEYLRSLTLNILGNMLSSEHNNPKLDLFINQNRWTAHVIDSLLWYIGMARISPWNACLAVKCLRLLVPTYKHKNYWSCASVALRTAKEFGSTSYKLLEKETQAALVVMNVWQYFAQSNLGSQWEIEMIVWIIREGDSSGTFSDSVQVYFALNNGMWSKGHLEYFMSSYTYNTSHPTIPEDQHTDAIALLRITRDIDWAQDIGRVQQLW